MKLTLAQMRAFLAVAGSLNFTRAAERLGVTQPTLSATIHNLELAIGGKLFDRDTRHVALTSLGLDCQRLAIQLLDEADRVESQLQSHVRGRRGLVRVAAPANLYPTVLMPGLMAFRAAHPTVRIEFSDVTTDEAVQQLRQGKADVAIGFRTLEEQDLRSRVIATYPYVAILPDTHALASRRLIRWRDIKSEEVVMLKARDSLSSLVMQTLWDSGVTPQVANRINEMPTATALINGGFGIGLMGYWSAAHILKPGLVIREIGEPAFNATVRLMTLASVTWSPQVRALLTALRVNALQYVRS